MESLTETPWDVIISGTGLTQSLLALALSRSSKKVLHVDKNPYYGGPEAAFSLQEAQDWVTKVNQNPEQGPFQEASIYSPDEFQRDGAKLSSRAYTLSLSPCLMYSRSSLLPALVSSKVYRQLEFQAVGSWWIEKQTSNADSDQADEQCTSLYRVPGNREDVFADNLITVKSKRTLMRFLRHISKDPQGGQEPSGEEDLSVSLPSYLTSKFQVPDELHNSLHSLSLSQKSPMQTPANYAVPRIKRHLASIGVLGPGFGGLLAKWGGGSEIAQVGCRALAVGGGTYVLGTGIQSFMDSADSEDDGRTSVQLSNGETVRTKFVVGSQWDLPSQAEDCQFRCEKVARSISVVSSPLGTLFAATAEGAPIPAGAVVVYPGSSLGHGDDSPPVYLLVHSSETGECQTGQSIIYGSISLPGQQGQILLKSALDKLLQSVEGSTAKVLWSLRYTQLGRYSDGIDVAQSIESSPREVMCFPPPSLDLAFDDTMVGVVKAAWRVVMGDDAADNAFMNFEDREGADED